MGICGGTARRQNQTIQNRQGNQVQTQQVEIITNQQAIQNQSQAKPEQSLKPEQPPQELPKPPIEEPDEEYAGDEVMQTIMRQFDELNNLFTEMQAEFDQITHYLLTIDDQITT